MKYRVNESDEEVNLKIEIAFDKMSIVKPSHQSWSTKKHLHSVGNLCWSKIDWRKCTKWKLS